MNILKELENLLSESATRAGYNEKFVVTFSGQPNLCDMQCNSAFALSKKYGKNPFDIAEEVVSKIEENELYKIEVVRPAFINITLTDKALEKILMTMLSDERGGLNKNEKPQRVLLDYGGANVAKALHIGHLRPAIIGESLKRLYRLLGDEVISDVHLGDWGLQMGLTELELFEEGKLDYYFGKNTKKEKLKLDDLNHAYPLARRAIF